MFFEKMKIEVIRQKILVDNSNMLSSNKKLSQLVSDFNKYPFKFINIIIIITYSKRLKFVAEKLFGIPKYLEGIVIRRIILDEQSRVISE